MPPRLKPKVPQPLFIAEWREQRGLTQEQLGAKLNTTGVSISRYETRERQPDLRAQEAIAEALGINVIDLRRDPAQPSADALLREKSPEVAEGIIKLIGQPPEVIERVLALVDALRK
jgi:transcriptional regulator with XRE-family HTH domain